MIFFHLIQFGGDSSFIVAVADGLMVYLGMIRYLEIQEDHK